ncbi:MAG TPA: phage major capsid protein [Trebonia sp.]
MASDLAKSLHDQELDVWGKIQSLAQAAATEKRNLTDDEQRSYDAMHAELDGVDKRLKDILEGEKRTAASDEMFASLEQRTSNPGANRRPNEFEMELRSFVAGERRAIDIVSTESRIMNRLATGRPVSPYEVRVLTDAYVAPGSFTNQTNAGIVPIDFYDQLLSYLIEVSGVMQTGPTVLNTAGGEPIQVPIVQQHTGLTTAGAQVEVSAAQSATLATADPGFGQKTLTANKFGILIQVARELIDDSGVNLLGYLAMSAGRAIGNRLGNALINGGDGISGSILGAPIAVTGGSASAVSGTNQVAGGPSYSNLIDMEYSVIAPYRQSRSCYWLAADQTMGSLRKLTDTVGRPLWEPSTVLGSPDLLLGKPLVADPFMPAYGTAATSIVFGDFSQYFVRMVGGVRFERSDDFAFGSDLVSFRAIIRADGQLMNPPVAVTPGNKGQPLVLFKGGATA